MLNIERHYPINSRGYGISRTTYIPNNSSKRFKSCTRANCPNEEIANLASDMEV